MPLGFLSEELLTFMDFVREERAPGRRYENAKTQSRDKKLDRKANSRKNTFLAQKDGGHHGTRPHCWRPQTAGTGESPKYQLSFQ